MDTTIGGRQYGREGDLGAMRDLIVAARAARAPDSSYWHVGDLVWGMFQNSVFDPTANIRLWHDANRSLLGFAWFDPPNEVQLEIHPSLRFDGPLPEAMLSWAEARRGQLAEGGTDIELLARALEDDVVRIAFLLGHGFVRSERHYVHFRRSLDGAIPEPALPDNLVLRPVGGEEEFEERVSIHRDVWHPSKVTLDAYRRLRAAPGYSPELDLAAVTLEGRFASYCICWLDEANGVGEFEPVGTRAEFRRRGIARAVTSDGLRRMRARGMHTAIVLTASFNEAAIRLYESVGFGMVNREYFYTKTLRAD